jgi:hypothetical protein
MCITNNKTMTWRLPGNCVLTEEGHDVRMKHNVVLIKSERNQAGRACSVHDRLRHGKGQPEGPMSGWGTVTNKCGLDV